MEKKKDPPSYNYKKAKSDYKIIKEWTAGIQLEGWEVKSLKDFGGEINGSFCKWNGKQLQLINSKITPLVMHAGVNPEPMRVRNLLLNKSELKHIVEGLTIKGYTCIPLTMYYTKSGYWKINIALVTGLKKWDKREQIKKRDIERQSRRIDI